MHSEQPRHRRQPDEKKLEEEGNKPETYRQPSVNGILRGWVDGGLAFEKTDVRMRDVDSLKIETVWLNLYNGGTWTAKADYHLYIDNVAISRRPIGMLAPAEAKENAVSRRPVVVGDSWRICTMPDLGE